MNKVFLVAFLCLLPFIYGQDYSCTINGGWANYDLTGLYKSSGNAYAGKDENGNIFYFNLCGTLQGLEEENLGCDPQASVCIQSETGVFFTAGRPGADWVQNSLSNVSINYNNGDLCASDNTNGYVQIETTITLICSEDQSPFTIVAVNYTDCAVNITALSSAACPKYEIHHRHVSGVLGFVLIALCVCASCLCICVCCRRRCRRNRACTRSKPVEMNSVAFHPIPQQPIQQVPQQMVAQPDQFVPMNMYPPQFQPAPMQYYQPYYVYPNMQTQQNPMVPFVQTNDHQLVQLETQADADEKLARELQAKFDNEIGRAHV